MSHASKLLDDYLRFCKLRDDALRNGTLDLSTLNWMPTTMLIPLEEFISANKDRIKIIMPKNSNVASYISIMTSEAPWKQPQGSYISIAKIPPNPKELEKSLQTLYENYKQGKEVGGENAFKYVISELSDNIYEHSQFTEAFVVAQVYPKMDCMEICFLDNGITIPGNFEKHKISFSNDADAIVKALKGQSTKDQERGKGLGTSMKIISEALKGPALIISGLGAVSLKDSQVSPYIVSDLYILRGTLISARIPFPSKKVDIYGYVE